MNKKILVSFIIIFVAIIGLSIYKVKKSTSATDKNIVKIGIIYPLSGNMGKFGQSAKIAADIFFADFNNTNSNFDYQLIWEDNQMQPSKSMTALSKLIQLDKVDIILSLFSNTGLAISPVVAENNILQINGTSEKKVADGKNNFIISYNAQDMVDLATHTMAAKNINKIDIICLNSSGMINLIDLFRSSAQNIPSLSINNTYMVNPGEKDFRTILSKISADRPDIILVQLQSPEIDILMKQLREQNITTPVTGLSTFMYMKDKTPAEGMWYVDSAIPSESFIERYQQVTGDEVTNVSEYFYAELELLTQLYNNFSSKPTNQQLVESIKSIPELDNTVIGKIVILPEGYIFAQPSLRIIKNGKSIEYKE